MLGGQVDLHIGAAEVTVGPGAQGVGLLEPDRLPSAALPVQNLLGQRLDLRVLVHPPAVVAALNRDGLAIGGLELPVGKAGVISIGQIPDKGLDLVLADRGIALLVKGQPVHQLLAGELHRVLAELVGDLDAQILVELLHFLLKGGVVGGDLGGHIAVQLLQVQLGLHGGHRLLDGGEQNLLIHQVAGHLGDDLHAADFGVVVGEIGVLGGRGGGAVHAAEIGDGLGELGGVVGEHGLHRHGVGLAAPEGQGPGPGVLRLQQLIQRAVKGEGEIDLLAGNRLGDSVPLHQGEGVLPLVVRQGFLHLGDGHAGDIQIVDGGAGQEHLFIAGGDAGEDAEENQQQAKDNGQSHNQPGALAAAGGRIAFHWQGNTSFLQKIGKSSTLPAHSTTEPADSQTEKEKIQKAFRFAESLNFGEKRRRWPGFPVDNPPGDR